jgi:hypothetical protein
VKQLSCIEHGLLRIQQPNHPNRVKKFHAIYQLSKEIDVVLVFERSDVFHHERRGDSGKG